VEVAEKVRHTSLLQFGIIDGGKMFYSTGPPSFRSTAHFFTRSLLGQYNKDFLCNLHTLGVQKDY
jgi:hypothetical protein